MAKKAEKGRYNFLINSTVYDDFSLLCEEQGLVRSKQVEHLLKRFLEEHEQELKKIKEEQHAKG